MDHRGRGYQPRDATPVVVVFEGSAPAAPPAVPLAPQAPRAPAAAPPPPPVAVAAPAPKGDLRSSIDSWSDSRDQVAPLMGPNVGYGAMPGMPPAPQQGVAGRRQMMTYGRREPLRRETSYVALLFCAAYLASLFYYVYVRLAKTIEWNGGHAMCAPWPVACGLWPAPAPPARSEPLPGCPAWTYQRAWLSASCTCPEAGRPLPSPPRSYQMYVFFVEMLGVSALIPYALLLVVSTRPTGSKGLPPDDGISVGEKVFNINVLVPCYSESLEVRGVAAGCGVLDYCICSPQLRRCPLNQPPASMRFCSRRLALACTRSASPRPSTPPSTRPSRPAAPRRSGSATMVGAEPLACTACVQLACHPCHHQLAHTHTHTLPPQASRRTRRSSCAAGARWAAT
jgi:hypothetical protein